MNEGMIRAVQAEDVKRICAIYNYYVQHTCISFEEAPVSAEEMGKRMAKSTPAYPFLVYEKHGELLGYAYAGKWKERSAYRFTAEVTVYIDKDHHGEGIGSCLLKALLEDMKTGNIHVLMAVIALPNEKSIRLHEKYGFVKAAHFTAVGFKQNRWIDVGYWELVIPPSNKSGRIKA